ncbi:MAG: flagellar basal body P-ring formation protein FlgA [Candidatus Desulfofervidaceae bacterium]|nr:flagellar basal body P-ring formation protein FlgA [Candidatus Desulfofervidaceae bacterium]
MGWWRYKDDLAMSVFILSLVLIPLALYSAPCVIRIPAKVKVKTAMVRLGDIVENVDVLPPKWKEVVLGNIAIPGATLEISKDYLRARLQQSGIPLVNYVLEMPATVKITRDYVCIPKKEIEKIARRCILERVPWKKGVQIEQIKAQSDLTLPPGHLSFQCLSPSQGNFIGSYSLPIVFFVDGNSVAKTWVIAKVKARVPVVVVAHPLMRGNVIGEKDVKVERREFLSIPAGIFSDVREVVGKKARRTMRVGEVVTQRMIEEVPLIKRGDRVAIVAESPVLKVVAAGQAKENGCKGELIKVINLGSRKVIYARVVDANTVKVEF